MEYLLINNQYALGRKLGSGSFGDIYVAVDKNKDENGQNKLVAIKLERTDAKIKLLNFESNVYKYLYQPNKGIPQIYWNGSQDDYNILIIEMLGPNLENLFALCGSRFSLKTTSYIAQELIKIFQYIHSKGILHRDIKPENFLIGFNNNNIYAIDFGLCKVFKGKNGQHIDSSSNKKLVGTVRYASINSHLGYELSRRDDLESIGYMLIYFHKGHLPWQGLGHKGISSEKKYQLIYECKQNTTTEQLCQGLPKEFKLYMEHVKSLGFDEKPNYNYLYNLFAQLHKKNQYNYDNNYDWTQLIGSKKNT